MKIVPIILLVVCFHFTTSAQTSNPSAEQIAYDYFAENTLVRIKNAKVFSSAKTEKSCTSFERFTPCFKNPTYATSSLNECKKPSEISINTRNKAVTTKRETLKNKRLSLYIYNATAAGNLHYVRITLIKKRDSAGHYFYVVRDNIEVVDWCYIPEYI